MMWLFQASDSELLKKVHGTVVEAQVNDIMAIADKDNDGFVVVLSRKHLSPASVDRL